MTHDALSAVSPLLAAGWLEGLAPLIVVVFWVLKQVLFANRADPPGGPEAPRRVLLPDPPLPDPNDPQAVARAEAQRAQRSEVEEFLRKVVGIEVADGQGPGAPPARPSLDPMDEPSARPRQRPKPKPTSAGTIEVLVGRLEDEVEAPRGEVGALSKVHLQESQLAEQAARLGSGVAMADRRAESRLHEKFDHRLGRLEGAGAPLQGVQRGAPSPAAASAQRVAELLRSPTGVRDAVLLGEILRRPDV